MKRRLISLTLAVGVALGCLLGAAGPAGAASAGCTASGYGDDRIYMSLNDPPASMNGYTFETWLFHWNGQNWQWSFDDYRNAYFKATAVGAGGDFVNAGYWEDNSDSGNGIATSMDYYIRPGSGAWMVFWRLTALNGYYYQDWINPYIYDSGQTWWFCNA